MTLEEGVRKKKNQREFRNRKRWGYYNTKRRDIQDITFGNRSTNWISGGGDQNYKAKCRYRTIGFCVDWDYNIVVRVIDVYKDINYYHFISIILQGFQGWNPKYRGVMLRGKLSMWFGMNKGIKIGIAYLNLNSCCLDQYDVTWDSSKVRVLKNRREKGEDETRNFERRVGGIVGTCSWKPQTSFWYNTNFKCCFGFFQQNMELCYNFERCF